MNFQEYMKIVEQRISVMTEEEKTTILRNMIRSIEETKREDMLRLLNHEAPDLSAKKEYEALKLFLKETESGAIHFYVSGYENFHEAPWGEEYEEEYEDRDRIGIRYRNFIHVADKLLINRCYKEALSFYEALSEIDLYAYSEENEELIDISLDEAIDEGLIETDKRSNIINLLYTCFQVYEGEMRCQKIYKILASKAYEKIKIDEIFSAGPEELKNREAFIDEWISYLKANQEESAGTLLSDVSYQHGGTVELVKTAREAGNFHPLLYLDACNRLLEERKYQEASDLADEALDILSENLVIRSNLAEAMQLAAAELDHQKNLKRYMKASYYADTNPLTFLKLCSHLDSREELEDAAMYAQSLPSYQEIPEHVRRGQWKENSITKEEKDAILLLSGKWNEVYEKYKGDKRSLGWSLSSKGIIIPLYLMSLYEKDHLEKATGKLWRGILNRLGGLHFDEAYICHMYGAWKGKFKIDDPSRDKYLTWIKEEVENRITGIVENSYRKSYDKAALLIAVLGEVSALQGEEDAKEKLITFYKKKYNRRRAFRAELDLFL